MNSKAIRKQLFAAVAMVLVAAVALGSSTYAWFAANKTVTAEGMTVNAATSSSLVISATAPVGTLTTASYSTQASTTLTPATHDEDVGTTTYLKYVENLEDIDAQTGYKATDGNALTYADAVNGANTYYTDFVFYVASAGDAMTSQKLTFQFTEDTKSALAALATDGTKDTQKAASIDFYVESVTSASASLNLTSYVGTLAYANANNDETGTFTTTGSYGIPVNGSTSNLLRITMRVYIDGQLQKAENQAYVYSNIIDTSEVTLGVQIDAVAAA